MTLRAILLTCLVGCGSCGGAQDGGEPEVPEALAELAEYAEITPYGDWPVEGVTLYRASWSVPDQSNAQIVGVDEAGTRIEREALMARFGELSAEQWATRAFGVLLGDHGGEPLTAEDQESISFGTEEEWAVVEPPRREGDTVIFFALEGEMQPTLVEHRLDLETFAVETRMATEVVLEAGGAVTVGDPRCVAYTSCGCWRGCVRVQERRSADATVFRVLDGESAGTDLVQREDCYEGTCFQVCNADSPDARCEPGTHAENVPCTGACAPSEAPYHCETLANGCRQVDHPNRSGSD